MPIKIDHGGRPASFADAQSIPDTMVGRIVLDRDDDVFLVAAADEGVELIRVHDSRLIADPIITYPVRTASPGVSVTIQN